jgi:protein-L-isoaspartate(D-aspartate) O-methyltransferase
MRNAEDGAAAAGRRRMVDEHLAARGIRDGRVLAAMAELPRHEFVDGPLRARAYEDRPLPIGRGQTISQPWIVARMTEALQLQGGERVLEIGTGSGYQAAVLSRLCRRVYTVERHEELLGRAREVFERLGLDNIVSRRGDGSIGWGSEAPFDGILVTAGAPEVPRALLTQLALGGRLVLPVGDRREQQLTILVRRSEEQFDGSSAGACTFVPLVGREGWKGETP